jgi:hypothetical protein
MDPPSVPRQVQFAVLLQLAENGTADRVTTATMVPGTDARDLTTALESLLDDGSIQGNTYRLTSMIEMAEGGHLTLTDVGRQRLDEDDV